MKEVRGESKKGQVTVFVIIALLIIVFGVLIYIFYPGLNSTVTGIEENPKLYLQDCVEDVLSENVETISSQGGSMEPDSSFIYNGVPIEYLCYSSDPYAPCTPQRALLVIHIEEEIKTSTKDKVSSCFDQMAVDYRGKGYDVNLNKGDFDVTLAPNKIILTSATRFEITKDSVQKYESFDVILDNNLFELASLARTIIIWEKNEGTADPFYIMNWYPGRFDIKKVSPDGGKTAIWTIEDLNTEDTFRFASSETEWPLGIEG
ncbi:MAG: hypothetical protein Q8Q04_02615 [archaeon]|nr:hypothetical protein [archaeon]